MPPDLIPQWILNGLARPGLSARKRRSLEYYWAKHRATPAWADKKAIAAIYREAERRRANGEKVHVDHIVPLKGQAFGVSGLHVAENLEIITVDQNYAKGAHTWPDQWGADEVGFGFEHEPHQTSLAF